MINIVDKIIDESRKKNTALVVGLDPNLDLFPKFLLEGIVKDDYKMIGKIIFEFNKLIIDSVSENIVAIKPQLAYYEVYGSHGILALEKTITYAKEKGLIIIHDAKRGDIGSTSEAYAKAFLENGPISGDLVTVNPYMGSDSYNPFIEKAKKNQKGIFILLKTSNPSSGELQNLTLKNEKPLYESLVTKIDQICRKTKGINEYSYVGAVVGATYPKEAAQLRKKMKNTLFLVPGFGAQGGSLENLEGFFDKNGEGAIVNSSRGIIYSYKEQEEKQQSITKKELIKIVKESSLLAKKQINKARFNKIQDMK